MNKILILTKNILAEQKFQMQLQLLNYEVFCSSDIYQSSGNHNIFSYFPTILLSETITDAEVAEVSALINTDNNLIIPLTDEAYSEDDQVTLRSTVVGGWLNKSLSNTMVREKLVLLQKNFFINTQYSNRPVRLVEEESYQHILSSVRFSKNERKVFSLLLQGEGRILSRTEICQFLWRDGETSSNRSQLSCIAAKIKSKLKHAGYDGETIITKWGQGYSLDSVFCKFMRTDRAVNVLAAISREPVAFDNIVSF
ncbi:winged helix-turn-helix domain-containing protein [Candidatus Enterococcus ferrettii]|uniref:OmpR/PhoB-type domain-containing protein n=1 Tax=Candidatus Enterococcus ferrettii TaxID=2815324 RepID=A0ABV0EQA1_9ENTE|nr:winged helix-turn-helix domain-containing protein [Enterococcus sp. 665A]